MNNIKKTYFITLALCFGLVFKTFSQAKFTKSDSLRGSITPERAWWDLLHYNLSVRPNFEDKTISGDNVIEYKVLAKANLMQIDLQPPLQLYEAAQDGKILKIKRIDKNVYHILLEKDQKIGATEQISLKYGGTAVEAKRPPWDGGLQWTKDAAGNPLLATSCQGIGASIWWPCKDHMYDEPDQGADIFVTVPKELTDVSNGRLIDVADHNDGSRTFHWQVKNPINNYGINMNVGKYSNWTETYQGEKGKLDISYYALTADLEKAQKQWQEVPRMLKAFEYWFGPYPFYEDGFKLVQVPYLGMEHQSSVTYGNKFRNGYLGSDLSGTGVGLLWDFIIVHESGHEWWANSITFKDIADMWIHESFTAYSETLFTEYHFGKVKASEYVQGTRKRIANKFPIIGPYQVNAEIQDTDAYYKGANMIHTIRQIVNNDETFRAMLRHLQAKYYHKTVTTAEIEAEISNYTKIDFAKVFDQYLRMAALPEFEYRWRRKNLEYRFVNCDKYFEMPLKVYINDKAHWLRPNTAWQGLRVGKVQNLRVDADFYVNQKLVKVPK